MGKIQNTERKKNSDTFHSTCTEFQIIPVLFSESDFMAEIIARVDEQHFKSCKLLNESPFLYTKMHIKCHHKLSPFDFFFFLHKLSRRKKKKTN